MINTIKATINLTNVCLDEVDLGNGVIYRGDDLATTLEIKAPVNSNAYVLLACITPNGRNLGPFNADNTTSTSSTTTYEFLLTKENGYNFAVGRTELIVYYCVVNSNSSISKKAIGSICVDVKKGVSVDDEATFIIGDTTDADAVLTDLNAKMDNLINQVATYSTQISNKLDAVKNTVTLTNTGTLFTSRVESRTDYTVQSQGRNGISSAVDSSVANNTENSTAQITTRTITDKTSSNSTEIKQTANYTTIKATDGTNTKTLAITPQKVTVDNDEVVTKSQMVTVDDVATKISISMDTSTYVVTINLLNENDEILDTASVDLPSESTVVSGSFDDTTNTLYLTLRSGSTITIPLSNLISGLASTAYVDTQDALKLDKSVTSSGNTTTITNSGTGSETKTVETGTILDGEYTEQTKRTATKNSVLEEYRYEDEGEDFNTTKVASIKIYKNSSNAAEIDTNISSSNETDNSSEYTETITSVQKTEQLEKNSTYKYKEETTAYGKTITATNTDSGDETVIALTPTGVTINGETLIDTGNIGTYAPKSYLHQIYGRSTDTGALWIIQLRCSRETAFTLETFAQFLYNNNLRSGSTNNPIRAINAASTTGGYYSAYSENGTSVRIYISSSATRPLNADFIDNVYNL